MMDHGDVAAVDDPVPGEAQLQTQVDVLEAVDVALVEAADRRERVGADRHAGRGHAVGLERAAGRRECLVLVVKDMLGHRYAQRRAAQERDPGVLDRPVGEQQPAAGDADAGLGGLLDERLECAGGHLGVVVEEDQHVAASLGGAEVAAAREVAVLAQQPDGRAVGPVMQQRRRVVGRVVIDHDDLPAVAEAVAERALERAQALLGQRTLAVGDDDDRGDQPSSPRARRWIASSVPACAHGSPANAPHGGRTASTASALQASSRSSARARRTAARSCPATRGRSSPSVCTSATSSAPAAAWSVCGA